MLPAPYENELFYSVVARFADRMGLRLSSDVGRFVFGRERITPTVEIPTRLDLLMPRLLPNSQHTPARLIAFHSLVPYYTAFMSEDRALLARAAVMAADANVSIKRLGISSLRNPLTLRLCTDCVADDRKNKREPYWRRPHQLPGVSKCHLHDLTLLEGPLVRGVQSSGFISVSRAFENATTMMPVVINAPTEIVTALAKASAALLNRAVCFQGGDLRQRFFEWLRLAGWNKRGQVSGAAVMSAVTDRLGANVLVDLGFCSADYTSRMPTFVQGRSTDWLARCFRYRASASHPLGYLLLLVGLNVDIDTFLHVPSDGGAGTIALDGPCINPICPVSDAREPRPMYGITSNVVLTIQCAACGFTYKQNPEVTAASRVVAFGPLWDEMLVQECQAGNATARELQDILGQPIYAIKRRAIDLGIWHPRWSNKARETTRKQQESGKIWAAKREEARRDDRAKWLDSVARSSRKPPIELNRAIPPFRDRGGGLFHSPTSDSALANLIHEIVDNILDLVPPKRASKVAIAHAMGKTRLSLNATYFPKSIEALAVIAESKAAFVVRQREWEASAAGSSGVEGIIKRGF